MNRPEEERRKYPRFETEVKLYYQVKYDIKTKVKFQIIDGDKTKEAKLKYLAISRNVSAEGICFFSNKELNKGDKLFLEVFLPSQAKPIPMEGEVCWSHELSHDTEGKRMFTGVRLLSVHNQSVADSIYYDDTYRVIWSIVLESIFGSFRKVMEEGKIKG